ncbi:MAG: DUF423 domain-containing protein [Ignavibacteriaceae bacterium]|nr:DUF423 domain-containing protein [Ignavibacteriaceae bacterium]
MMNKKQLIIIAGILGFLAVSFGAFGTHTLKDQMTDGQLKVFQTGVFYHFIHTIIILIIAFSNELRFFKAAAVLAVGIILFSFSLYIYSTTNIRLFAIITPVGGFSFLIGWLLIIIEGIRQK